jgi:hypothetical protein
MIQTVVAVEVEAFPVDPVLAVHAHPFMVQLVPTDHHPAKTLWK